MSQLLTNGPLNTPTYPMRPEGSACENELIDQFLHRLKYIGDSYFVFSEGFKSCLSFNDSVGFLEEALDDDTTPENISENLDLEILAALGIQASIFAQRDGVKVHAKHRIEAAGHITNKIGKRQGRPTNPLLEHHLTGLIALVQEFSGLSVHARRDKNSEYKPHFPKGISEIIPVIVRSWEPRVTDTQLVNLIRKIRKKHKGKPLRFSDYFLGYGMTLTPLP